MAVRKLGDVAVGTIVKIDESGIPIQYRIIQQGKPSSGNYDYSCDGTWIRRVDVHSNRQWHTRDYNDYANSSLHQWLNNEISGFLSFLDPDIRAAVKRVKIPYRPGQGTSSSVSSGADGLSCKVFLPSMKEVDLTPSTWPTIEGAPLAYYAGGGDSKRVANFNGYPASTWSRTPRRNDLGNIAFGVDNSGSDAYWYCSESHGVQPAFILPQSLYVLDDGTVIVNQPPTAPASITASNIMGGQQATVTLGAATDTDGQIINYTYERQVDGGSWTQFASENSLTVTDSIDDSWTTVAYRARAMDDMGAEGPYAASEVYTVVHNLPPTAPGSIQVTNVTTGQEATVTLTAATDPDGTVASYIYERSVDGAEFQPFANVNSLTQTDHISGDWGTVAYRACAVDDDGAAGPYVTSETKTVTTGLVTIAGPAVDLGEKPMPFAFWFSCGVSDQTAVQDIAVRVTVDGKDFFTGTLDSGAAKGLYIDTRFRGAGQHTIAVTASKEDYQPAAASYTFTVPSVTLPYEGRAEMPQNSAGQPVWWYGLARFIFGEDGKDLITLMQEMQAASLKMVTGSYQGTGQSGSSNPNILAAAFTPKAVMLSSGSDAVLLAIPEEGDTGTTDGISYTKASTGVSWFAGDAAAQYNESGKIYRYVMFG